VVPDRHLLLFLEDSVNRSEFGNVEVVSLGQVDNFLVHPADGDVELSVLFTELQEFTLESSEDINNFGESVLEFANL